MKKLKKTLSVILVLLLLFSTLSLSVSADEPSPSEPLKTALEDLPLEPTVSPVPPTISDPYTEHHEIIESEYGGKYALVLPDVEDISQPYSESHLAMDMVAEEGSPVIAADEGTVVSVQVWDGTVTEGNNNSYGNMVQILHTDGITTLYAHLSEINVREGDNVIRGQKIGRVGSTGNSTGAHLHFEVIAENGMKVNPRHLILPIYTLAEWTDVNAVLETTAYYGIKNAPSTITFGAMDNEILVRYVQGASGDSMVAYCIQYGVATNFPKNYKQGSIVDMYGQEKADIIGDILSVGFTGYGDALWNNDNCSKWAATQMALWEITRDSATAENWHTAQSAEDVNTILGYTPRPAIARATYAEIIQKVLTKNTKPSFDGDTVTLKWDGSKYTASVADANDILSSFGSYSASGLNFSKSGNTLTISTNAVITDPVTATATKSTDFGGSGAAIAWVGRTDSSLQWISSFSRGSSLSVKSTIKIKTDTAFDITLTKTSANVKMTTGNSNYSLEGAVYNVYKGTAASGTVAATFTTDKNGKATLSKKLPNGTYAVKEKTAPKGYVLDPTVHIVTINNGNAALNVTDDPQYIKLTVVKKDAASKTSTPQGNASLAGAVYSVTYKENGKDVTVTGTTNQKGIVYFLNIPLGTVKVQETKAPVGYKLDSTIHTYTITSDKVTSAVYELEPEDDYLENVIMNTITIQKTAETATGSTEKESGAEFQVYLKSAGSYNTAKASERDTITTGTDGKATTKELPYGVYTVHQISGGAGRELASDFDVTISADTSSVSSYAVDVVNKMKLGSLQIQKSSEDGEVGGLEFKITRNIDSWSKTVKTGSNGKVTISNLPVFEDIDGKKPIEYTVTEINTPPQYIQPKEQTFTLIASDTVTVKMENKLGFGSLRVIKVDQDGKTPLSGAVYKITDSAGKIIATKTTDKNGMILVEGLKVGTQYYYEETTAPEGYKRDTNKYPFKLTAHKEILEKTMKNTPSTGSVQIKKVDNSGAAMSGATFLLEYSADNGKTWSPVTARKESDKVSLGGCTNANLKDGTLTTNKNGIVHFTGLQTSNQLVTLQYRLTETSTNEDRTLLTAPLCIDLHPIDESKETLKLEYTAVNNSNFELPRTGGNGYPTASILAVTTALSVFLAFLIFKRYRTQ